MNIVHYLPYSYHIHTGGLEKIAQTIAEGLAEQQNIQTLIVASDVRRQNNKTDLAKYSDTLFLPSWDLVYNFPVPKLWKKEFWESFQKIKKENPDVIVTHTRFFVQSLIGGLIAKWLWYKRVHVEHGSGFVTGYPRYIKTSAWLFDRTIGLRIFRQCDEIVTISQMHRTFISKFTSKEPIVIYNPIDYVPAEKIKHDVVHIGFIASLLPRKWCDLLLEALANLRDQERICTIVGEGSERKKLEEIMQDLGLHDRVIFVGADDREHRLHKFDIFVNPSHQEGLPTTVVEALLAQCIVVATDVGGTREISDQKDLILVHDTVVSVQGWLEQAFAHLDKSGQSLKAWLLQKFEPAYSIGQYLDVIQAA